MPDAEATNLIDRARGCILGGVIGDAMGGPFEGQPGPLQFQEHNDWSISDDSQLTLATCESIIELDQVSPEHIAQRFLHWHKKRQIASMGASTLKALRDLEAGVHWALAGAKGERAAGNGAAMRIAPLAFHLNPDLAEHRRTIRDVCRITHHHEESYVGALAIVAAIRWLARGESQAPSQLLANVLTYLPDSLIRDRLQTLSELRDDLVIADVASQFGSTGYAADSVPLALYAAQSIARLPFAVVLCNVIEAGGDTDTIASMAGQVAGVWLGASRIPRDLVESIPNLPAIERTTGDFAVTVKTL